MQMESKFQCYLSSVMKQNLLISSNVSSKSSVCGSVCVLARIVVDASLPEKFLAAFGLVVVEFDSFVIVVSCKDDEDEENFS